MQQSLGSKSGMFLVASFGNCSRHNCTTPQLSQGMYVRTHDQTNKHAVQLDRAKYGIENLDFKGLILIEVTMQQLLSRYVNSQRTYMGCVTDVNTYVYAL